jgi:serine/threonine protein kinase
MGLSHAELGRLSQLLDEALDLPIAEREAWLASLPEADAALKATLEAALADAEAEDTGGPTSPRGLLGVLDALPQLAGVAAEARMAETGPGRRQVGPYRLLRPLGHGGMGSVWLAERVDGGLQRAVALKLPHASAMQRPELARRFDRERDILAALEHPHIARLYDAGVADDGQPYLAMEYVEGQPLTTWCDEHQLPLRARVDLFLQVLEAVQYAHARLVVHRDLKPTNILVTAGSVGVERPVEAVPGDRRAAGSVGRLSQVRLLDFGIATLLADDGSHAQTEWAQAPMTPDYASPEQIGGRPIGTASDVYSLGVVFYELVTGQRPYRLARDSRGALEDAILGVQPTKPSRSATTETAAAQRAQRPAALRRQLRGDLDNIALMALRKNPAERYPSAEAFKQDLQRWLRNKPVHAHPGSWWYRARKFVQRHKLPVAATALAGTGMLVGLAVALHQAEAARRESQRTLAVQGFLVGLFNEADPARAQGRELTVRDLMARGERDLQAKLGSEPDLQAAMTAVLIDIYDKLGDGKRALPLAESHRDLMASSHGEGSLEHARSLLTLAAVQKSLGQHEASLATVDQAEPMLERHVPRDGPDLSRLRGFRGSNLIELTRYAEGRAVLQAELPVQIRLHGKDSYPVAQTLVRIATSYSSEGKGAEAAQALRDLQPLLQRDWTNLGMGPAALRADVGYTQWQMRQFPEAIATLKRSVAEFDHLAGPYNTQSIQANRTLAMAYLDAGQFQLADAVLAENVARSRRLYGEKDSETGLNLSFHVMTLLRSGQLDQAEQTARESVEIAVSPGSTLSASEVRGFKRRYASALALNGKPAEGLSAFDELIAQERTAGLKDTRHAATLMLRGGVLNLMGRGPEAVAAAASATAAWREAGARLGALGQVGVARARLNEALAWVTAGEPARAEALIDDADGLFRQAYGATAHPDLQIAALVRAQWLKATGRPAEADALERQARARYRELSGLDAPRPMLMVY